MDKLEQYRQLIETILTEYVATPISNGEIESQTVFDIQLNPTLYRLYF